MSVEAVPYEALGRPIRGPRALNDDPVRFWHLTLNIAVNQWKLRFFGSALGYVWQLVRPLLLFTVLYVFFTKIAKVNGAHVGDPSYDNYGAQLLGSIVLFTFFAEATMGSVRCVLDNEALVRKIQFPRMVIPLSIVLLCLFNLVLNLVVVFIFALLAGVRPMLTWLELPLIVLMLAVLVSGLSMLLSSLFIYFRDIQPIWEVINQVLFYSSPVIIAVPAVVQAFGPKTATDPAGLGVPALTHVYMSNPLAVALQQFRHAVINHATPGPATVLGSQTALLVPIGIVVVVFVFGFYVFNRTAPYVAENL
ncbi:MAG TPA: ABC transporter permease [Solirubrobacteraceae bacterium]